MSEELLTKLITSLKTERDKVERAIASLEELLDTGAEVAAVAGLPRRSRGRHSMGLEERKQVSERMKKYWASRHGAS
jgi:hypothetical protein